MDPIKVHLDDVLKWWKTGGWSGFTKALGSHKPESHFLSQCGVPIHLQFVLEQLSRDEELSPDVLDSIPFYSLCRSVFLPLLGLQPHQAAQNFGIRVSEPPQGAARLSLMKQFLQQSIGLTLVQKLGCLTCDPYFGRASTFRQDRLLNVLLASQFVGRRWLLDRLAHVGDVAVLFAESRKPTRCDSPLTANEVLTTIRFLPDAATNQKLEVVRSLLSRCGKLEAYCLARLLLGRNGPGLGVALTTLANLLAQHFDVEPHTVTRCVALTDLFQVARAFSAEGVDGLRRIRLQPLCPVRPALAGGTADRIKAFPVWVERKYDGVRFLLHKSTDSRGSVLCGAYTRNGNDWLELVPGLDATIKKLSVHSLILDGELCGTLFDDNGIRPASVYDVVSALKSGSVSVTLKFVAFDVLYLNGVDMTPRPMRDRLNVLANLFLDQQTLPVTLSTAQGFLARDMADVNRLYSHFRAQGHEGIIAKDLDAPYAIAARDPNWLKRKPEVTLDLAILGATYAVNHRRHGMFGSFVMGARDASGQFVDIGDVDSVDQLKETEIQRQIIRDGLTTGRRIERRLTEGTRAGVELRPSIVVTVVFQEIMRESDGNFVLRHPRVKLIRADKSVEETDSVQNIAELYSRQGMR